MLLNMLLTCIACLHSRSTDGRICAEVRALGFLLLWSLWCLTDLQCRVTHIFILRLNIFLISNMMVYICNMSRVVTDTENGQHANNQTYCQEVGVVISSGFIHIRDLPLEYQIGSSHHQWLHLCLTKLSKCSPERSLSVSLLTVINVPIITYQFFPYLTSAVRPFPLILRFFSCTDKNIITPWHKIYFMG